MICIPDVNGTPLKRGFFPVTSGKQKGCFDVICESSDGDDFSNALKLSKTGDEFAFKSGKVRLIYPKSDATVSSITIVASGKGIAPSLQLLYKILLDADVNIDDVELLWINPSRIDFLLNKEVEELEYKFHQNLHVTRVVDNDLCNSEVAVNRKVYESVTPYARGRMAVLCMVDDLIPKAYDIMEVNGYQRNSICEVQC